MPPPDIACFKVGVGWGWSVGVVGGEEEDTEGSGGRSGWPGGASPADSNVGGGVVGPFVSGLVVGKDLVVLDSTEGYVSAGGYAAGAASASWVE